MKKVLVVIDPDQDNLQALNRAAYMAQNTDCTLDVILSVDSPKINTHGVSSVEELLEDIRATEHDKLLTMVQPLVDYGYKVETKVILHKPALTGILNRAVGGGADLVIKTSDYQSSIKRSIFSHLDWQLIRECPRPLLLCKHEHWPERPKIAVAVDPMHDFDKPADLDNKLIEVAKSLQAVGGGELALVHACAPSLLPIATQDAEAVNEKHRLGLHQLAERHSIDSSATHFLIGQPEQKIAEYVQQFAVDLLVTGVMSRSLIDKWILGSTAERLLDRIACDLLVVKPDRQ